MTTHLGQDFQNWSWATVNLANATPTHSAPASISFEPDAFEGLYFSSPSLVRSYANFDGLRFWVHGGTSGNQNILIKFQLGQTPQHRITLNPLEYFRHLSPAL